MSIPRHGGHRPPLLRNPWGRLLAVFDEVKRWRGPDPTPPEHLTR